MRLSAFVTTFLCFLFTVSMAQAQQFEGYKNRVLGAEPPVIEAVLDQDIEQLRKLWLKDRPRYQDRGQLGRTALMSAAMIGNLEIVDFLITKDALLEAADEAGNTALHYGATQGHVEIVKGLLAAGANMNSTNSNGEVPLFLAARQGHWDVIKLLLDCGADTEITDYTARGLMDYAAMAKDRRILRKLQKRLQ